MNAIRKMMGIVAVAGVVVAMLMGVGTTQAEIIYHDNFDGTAGTALNGEAPDTAPGSEVWGSGTANFEYDGAGSVVIPTAADGRSIHLPLTIQSGLTYTLTARIKNSRTDDRWFAIGWAEEDSYEAFNANNSNGDYWMLWRGTDELAAYEGANTGNKVDESAAGSHPGESDELDVRIILDQLVATPTATFQYKDPSASTWSEFASTGLTQARLDAITRVGISGGYDTDEAGTEMGISSFTLEAIPEPASGMLVLAALGIAYLRRKLHA